MKLEINNQYIKKNEQPFFYLADTCWSAFTNIDDEEWEYYLDYRRAQGFNTLQINILPQWDASSTKLCYHPFTIKEGIYQYHQIDVTYFSHAEKMCTKAKEYGFELALVVLWCNYVPDTWASSLLKRGTMPFECIEPYIEMVHKTFSKLNPIYVISGDSDFETDLCLSYYTQAAKKLKSLAPNCLYTTHIKGRYTKIPDTLLQYLDFCFYQSGHNVQNLAMPYLLAEKMKQLYPDKPIINSEPCYEEMGYSRQMYGRWSRYDIRRAAWMSLLSGASAGISYGAAGIYNWHKTSADFETNTGEGFATPKCWQQALNFPGAWDYGYISYLFNQYQLFDIEPCQELLKDNNPEIRVARNKHTIIIYIPSNLQIDLNINLSNWKSIAIDLENRAIGILKTKIKNNCTTIAMTYFHNDALYIFKKL